jgi:hypothetical protein
MDVVAVRKDNLNNNYAIQNTFGGPYPPKKNNSEGVAFFVR